jgi:SAM-dependent methyltransferase
MMTINHPCDNCHSQGMAVFYEVEDIPVHSNVLLHSQAEALAQPLGHMQLGFCSTCGFISNLRFDVTMLSYSSSYEDSQGFSPRFQAFIEQLADRLIARYGLRQKDILEIGCGKGDFITLLCERGGNRGIGIDPSYDPARSTSGTGATVHFIKDYFSGAYAHLLADFICCRHTLEHLPNTASFIRMLREAIGDRTDLVVFFEVPDTERILHECAFWDIYHEHCSYFSPTSLIYLFQSCGFDVLDFNKDFDSQYLLIEVKPATGCRPPTPPSADQVGLLSQAIASFQRRYQDHLYHWQQRFQQLRSDAKRTVIWGAGSKAVGYLTTLHVGDAVADIVDINPYKQGMYLPGTGHRIVAPESLRDHPPDVVIVMNPIYRDEICHTLREMGLQAECIAVT